MKTEEGHRKKYAIFAGGAALATASSIAGTVWAIFAIVFGIIGQATTLSSSPTPALLGIGLSLAAGIASYRWAFNYFMAVRKEL